MLPAGHGAGGTLQMVTVLVTMETILRRLALCQALSSLCHPQLSQLHEERKATVLFTKESIVFVR